MRAAVAVTLLIPLVVLLALTFVIGRPLMFLNERLARVGERIGTWGQRG